MATNRSVGKVSKPNGGKIMEKEGRGETVVFDYSSDMRDTMTVGKPKMVKNESEGGSASFIRKFKQQKRFV